MIGEKTDTIALLIQMSVGPNFCSTVAAACSTASGSDTSSGSTSASPPNDSISRFAASSPSRPRAMSATRAPRRPNARAVARPTPAEAPVMTTTSRSFCIEVDAAMNLPSILLWGFGATIVLTTLAIAGQSLGLTRIDIPFIVGTMFTADRDRAKVIGVVVHAINGWLFAIVYPLFFENLHDADWWFGALIGAVQGVFVVVVLLPVLPGVHPRMV